MLRFLTVLLVLSLGCAAKPPTTNEVPETLTLTSTTGSGTATLHNTDSNGGSWTQTVPVSSAGVTYTMSVYHNSTGTFTVTANTPPLNYNYTFGTVAGSGVANPTSTPVSTSF